MANEHVLMTQKTIPISMTCADGTGLEKGAVVKLTDPNTVAAAAAESDVVGGIIYAEKIASDGMTEVAVLTGPGDELKAYASGAVAIGDVLMIASSGATKNFNYLAKATAGLSGGCTIGISREAAANGETFKYVLQIGAGT